ncbi:MAG: RidA family protein [Dehalococcoidia bacterium]
MAADVTTESAEARLRALGLELPKMPPPAGTYLHAIVSRGVLMTAGHIPLRADGTAIFGRLGADLDADAGCEAARVAGLGVLATIRDALGTLDRVSRFVRVYGVVNATPEFLLHTKVINGASDLFVEVFGEAGQHARLAVGVASLPFNIALEVEATIEVRE